MILENKTAKILDFDCPRKLHPLKIYMHTVFVIELALTIPFLANLVVLYF